MQRFSPIERSEIEAVGPKSWRIRLREERIRVQERESKSWRIRLREERIRLREERTRLCEERIPEQERSKPWRVRLREQESKPWRVRLREERIRLREERLRDEPRRRGRVGRRAGLTLVELLIVVTILLMLLGVGVPLMRPSLETGRLREAARQVNAYCATAKARAVSLGRPAGIWLERNAPGSDVCLDLFMAEMPAPYSGDLENARVRFWNLEDRPGRPPFWVADQRMVDGVLHGFTFSETMHGMLDPTADFVPPHALIRPGETFWVRFNFSGPMYEVTRGGGTPPPNPRIPSPAQFALRPGVSPPTGARQGEAGLPFQVFRAPVRTPNRALQLTGGAVVDLRSSGTGLSGFEFAASDPDDQTPVIIMFLPGGGVERIYHSEATNLATIPRVIANAPPTSTIHLLVGRTEGIEQAGADEFGVAYTQNVADPETIWISIAHRTGLVTSANNLWDPTLLATNADRSLGNFLAVAREAAQAGEMLGGR